MSEEAQTPPAPGLNPAMHSLSDLQNGAISLTLWYRLHVLLFDLQHFGHKPDSMSRLEAVTDASYIGSPYFTPDEAEVIKNTAIREKTSLSKIIEEQLQERLERRIKKRVNSGDFRVCAAHDLAPIIGTALGIDFKRLDKDKRFLGLLETKGLDLGEETWSGLTAKSYSPGNKGRGRKGKH